MSQDQPSSLRDNTDTISELNAHVPLHIQNVTLANAQAGLLRLAPELRNKIYDLLLIITVNRIEIKNGRIKDQPALTAVCRQIRMEFRGLFNYTAPMTAALVKCRIHNYNFTSVIAFIRELDKEQIDAVDAKGSLELQMTVDDQVHQHADDVLHWFRFCDTVAQKPITKNTYVFSGNPNIPNTDRAAANMGEQAMGERIGIQLARRRHIGGFKGGLRRVYGM